MEELATELARLLFVRSRVGSNAPLIRDAMGSDQRLLPMRFSEIEFRAGTFRLYDDGHGLNPDHPVQNVTWYGAAAYSKEYPIEMGIRGVRSYSIGAEGTVNIQRLVIAREYAEDPVYFSLVPQPTFAARRTTMLIFNRTGDTVERLTVNRYPMGEPYESAWSGGNLDEQWQALGELIKEKNPGTIGINVSRHWPVADGLTLARKRG